MIINPIICENCGEGLQPNMLGMKLDNHGDLIRVCCHCKYEVNVDEERRKLEKGK